jgi:hypothetical protein
MHFTIEPEGSIAPSAGLLIVNEARGSGLIVARPAILVHAKG